MRKCAVPSQVSKTKPTHLVLVVSKLPNMKEQCGGPPVVRSHGVEKSLLPVPFHSPALIVYVFAAMDFTNGLAHHVMRMTSTWCGDGKGMVMFPRAGPGGATFVYIYASDPRVPSTALPSPFDRLPGGER